MTLLDLAKIYNDGEQQFFDVMSAAGYQVTDETNNPFYWGKDIDFFVTNPYTQLTFSFEVKWDKRLADTHNFYFEIENPRSKGGAGWFNFCEADYLAYGDAINNCFYIIPMEELREYITENLAALITKSTMDGSRGLIVPVENLWNIARKIEL